MPEARGDVDGIFLQHPTLHHGHHTNNLAPRPDETLKRRIERKDVDTWRRHEAETMVQEKKDLNDKLVYSQLDGWVNLEIDHSVESRNR
jgi:hypothetical protein